MQTKCSATLQRVNLPRLSRIKNRLVPLFTLGLVSRRLARATKEQDIRVKIERGRLWVYDEACGEWNKVGFSWTTARRLNGYVGELEIASSATPREIRKYLRALMKRPSHLLTRRGIEARTPDGEEMRFPVSFREFCETPSHLRFNSRANTNRLDDFIMYGAFTGALATTGVSTFLIGRLIASSEIAERLYRDLQEPYIAYPLAAIPGLAIGFVSLFVFLFGQAIVYAIGRMTFQGLATLYYQATLTQKYDTLLKSSNNYPASPSELRRLEQLFAKKRFSRRRYLLNGKTPREATPSSYPIVEPLVVTPPLFPIAHLAQGHQPGLAASSPQPQTPPLRYPARLSGEVTFPDAQAFIKNPRPITDEVLLAYALYPADQQLIRETGEALVGLVRRQYPGFSEKTGCYGSTARGTFLGKIDFDLMGFIPGYGDAQSVSSPAYETLDAYFHSAEGKRETGAIVSEVAKRFHGITEFDINVYVSHWKRWRYVIKLEIVDIKSSQKIHLADIQCIPDTHPSNDSSMRYTRHWFEQTGSIDPAEMEVMIRNIRMCRAVFAALGIRTATMVLEQMIFQSGGSFDGLLERFYAENGVCLDGFSFPQIVNLNSELLPGIRSASGQLLDLAKRYHQAKAKLA